MIVDNLRIGKLIGVKLSIVLLLVNIWGTIQLSLMGVFFNVKPPGLIEDVHIPHKENLTITELYELFDNAYENTAMRCWIAASISLVTALISLQQYLLNKEIENKPLWYMPRDSDF